MLYLKSGMFLAKDTLESKETTFPHLKGAIA